MLHRQLVLALVAVSLVVGCHSTSNDRRSAESIVGTWVDSNSPQMASRSFSYSFGIDGELEVRWGREHPAVRPYVEAAADAELVPTETGTWRIQNGWLHYEISKCNMFEHSHEPFRYRLLEVSDEKLVFETAQGEETYFRARES